VPQAVNGLEPGSIEFQIVEFWQLKCTGNKNTTMMAESSSKQQTGCRSGVATCERERREEGRIGRNICFSPERTKVSRKQSQPNGLAMFTVCEVLQRARLDQGIDLATVAARTKINAKYLQAIEAGDRKSLPGGSFTRVSFISTPHSYGWTRERSTLRSIAC
jgi:hypothetical protein